MNFVVLPNQYQGFFLAKYLILNITGALGAFVLVSRPRISLPKFNETIFGWLLLLALCGISSYLAQEWTLWLIWISATVVYIFSYHLSEKLCITVSNWLWYLALIQVLVLFTQLIFPAYWTILPVGFFSQRSSGLIGNREFLATLLGVSLLTRFPTASHFKRTNKSNLLGVLAIIGSLILISSKGTLLLIALTWLLSHLKKIRPIHLFLGLIPVITIALLTHSVRARLFLWLIGMNIGLTNLPWGSGINGVENQYFITVEKLFFNYPQLANYFGDLPGVIGDLHNIFFQNLAEYGLFGLLATVLLYIGCLKSAITSSNDRNKAILIFALGKMLYTVVLSSPVSIFILAIGLGVSASKESETNVILTSSSRVFCFLAIPFLWFPLIKSIQVPLTYSQGYLELRVGEMAKARQSFNHVLELNPQHADSWLGLAYVALKSRPPYDPSPYLQKSLIFSQNFNTMKIAAKIFLESGDCYNATLLYERIHLAYPQHLTSISNLAKCHLALGNKELARRYAEILIRTQPRVPTKTYGLNLLTSEAILERLVY